MVGAEGLLGSKTYYIEQLTSGFPETAGVNCIKMARIIKYLILMWNFVNHGEDNPETQSVIDHYRAVTGKTNETELFKKGRTLYELWLTEDLTPAFMSEGVTMTQEVHNTTVLETLSISISPLDFLGFDITKQGNSFVDPDLGVVLPVLSKDRILKAMVFQKSV